MYRCKHIDIKYIGILWQIFRTNEIKQYKITHTLIPQLDPGWADHYQQPKLNNTSVNYDYLIQETNNSGCNRQAQYKINTSYYFFLNSLFMAYLPLQNYNHFQNILRLFDILSNFLFTTCKTMRDYHL